MRDTASDADGGHRPGGGVRSAAAPTDVLHRLARRAAHSAWGTVGSRVGLAARGVVYLVLAYLVARVALGALGGTSTSKPASGTGVAQELAAQSGGRIALLILAIGLVLYALFSVLDAILHHDQESPAAKRWGDRALSGWGFVVYGAFGGYCFATVASGAGSQSAVTADVHHALMAQAVLRWPSGWLLLAALGVLLLVIAGFLVSRAARRSFRPRLERAAMGLLAWHVAMVLGAVGYLGRAGLFGIVGWFVLQAAIRDDPAQGQGVDGSVRLLALSAAGPYLLWALAASLGLYGLYMFAESRYRIV